MSEIKDDPREVLVLLNSLGFVGITATQLKAFMKDLKIYRKIKEREKQQRREEMKAKIISKQQALIKEAYGLQDTVHSSSNIVPSESSNSFDNESLVKIRIKCISKEKNVQCQKNPKEIFMKSNEKSSTKYHKEDVIQVADSDRIDCEQDRFNAKPYSITRCPKSEAKQNLPKSSRKESYLTEKCKRNADTEEQVKTAHEHLVSEPTVSDHMIRPRSKSTTSDPTGNMRTQSALSTRSSVNTIHKSFIRPWRLQPDAQKSVTNKNCDPVALYQKYQQEWKQISFPGEAKHSKVRWAVREKMLGGDPHPMPLPRKSASMPILKKK